LVERLILEKCRESKDVEKLLDYTSFVVGRRRAEKMLQRFIYDFPLKRRFVYAPSEDEARWDCALFEKSGFEAK